MSASPLRVLMVSSLWPPSVIGGAELYASRLAAALRARGHVVGAFTLGVDGEDVVGVVRPWPYRLDTYAEQPAWKRALFHARDVYDPATARALRRTVARWRPDVVHSHSVRGLSVAALTAPRPAARVHHLHDYSLLCQRDSLTRRDGRSCETRCGPCRVLSGVRTSLLAQHRPDLVLSVSQAVTDEHRPIGWLAPLVRLHPLPADHVPTAFTRDRSAGPVTFGYLGQLTAVKGVRTLLAAFDLLARGSARLVIAGRGALADDIAAHARGRDDVDVRGWVAGEEREQFFADLDALVVPSEWKEPGGTVNLEARSRGLITVVSDIGGVPEYVDVASRPLLFAPGDVAALAASLARVVEEPDRYRPTTPPGPAWPEHIDRTVELYREAIEPAR